MAEVYPCPKCGQSLQGHQIGDRCPECGLVVHPSSPVMRPRELFVLGVRLLGVWFILNSLQGIVGTLQYFAREYVDYMSLINGWALAGIAMPFVVGFYCIAGAPHVVSLIFGRADADRSKPAPPTQRPV